jgi:hypothetical protein
MSVVASSAIKIDNKVFFQLPSDVPLNFDFHIPLSAPPTLKEIQEFDPTIEDLFMEDTRPAKKTKDDISSILQKYDPNLTQEQKILCKSFYHFLMKNNNK